MLSLEQDEQNLPYITPWDRTQHEAAIRFPDFRHFIIEGGEGLEPVGFLILIGCRSQHQSLELKRMVVQGKGQGFGRAALRVAKRVAFDDLNAHRFWLDVKQRNQRAKAFYDSEGFVVEGTLRDAVRMRMDGRQLWATTHWWCCPCCATSLPRAAPRRWSSGESAIAHPICMLTYKLLSLQPNKIMQKQLLNWKQFVVCGWPAAGCCGQCCTPTCGGIWTTKAWPILPLRRWMRATSCTLKMGKISIPRTAWLSRLAQWRCPLRLLPLVGAANLSPKLQTFFDVSPNFKAVKHHMREASRIHQIDFELLQAVIATESGFDSAAVSPKGAVGLMQLMPPTAQRYGVKADAKTTIEKKLTDPKTNILAGSPLPARFDADVSWQARPGPGRLQRR